MSKATSYDIICNNAFKVHISYVLNNKHHQAVSYMQYLTSWYDMVLYDTV